MHCAASAAHQHERVSGLKAFTKLLLVGAAAAGGYMVYRQRMASRAEDDLWSEATNAPDLTSAYQPVFDNAGPEAETAPSEAAADKAGAVADKVADTAAKATDAVSDKADSAADSAKKAADSAADAVDDATS